MMLLAPLCNEFDVVAPALQHSLMNMLMLLAPLCNEFDVVAPALQHSLMNIKIWSDHKMNDLSSQFISMSDYVKNTSQ